MSSNTLAKKKPTTKNSHAKKVPAKSAPAKKAAAKKTAAKKTAVKKVAAKKSAAKQQAPSVAAIKAASQVVDVVERGKVVDLNFIGSKDESAEARNVASRVRVRGQLDAEIEAFLSGGGKIASIEPNVMADPPRKPESNYGSRPI